MNKKGNILDIMYVTGIFFAVVVLAITLGFANSEFNDVIQGDSSISADAKTPVQDFNNRINPAMDSGLILAFVAAHIGVIFLGLLMRSHPMIFPIMMIGLLSITMMAGIISNSWDSDVAGDATFSSIETQYPMTSWILDNYLMVTLVMGFVDLVLFFGLNSLIEGGGL